jgi:hypothetical protein
MPASYWQRQPRLQFALEHTLKDMPVVLGVSATNEVPNYKIELQFITNLKFVDSGSQLYSLEFLLSKLEFYELTSKLALLKPIPCV